MWIFRGGFETMMGDTRCAFSIQLWVSFSLQSEYALSIRVLFSGKGIMSMKSHFLWGLDWFGFLQILWTHLLVFVSWPSQQTQQTSNIPSHPGKKTASTRPEQTMVAFNNQPCTPIETHFDDGSFEKKRPWSSPRDPIWSNNLLRMGAWNLNALRFGGDCTLQSSSDVRWARIPKNSGFLMRWLPRLDGDHVHETGRIEHVDSHFTINLSRSFCWWRTLPVVKLLIRTQRIHVCVIYKYMYVHRHRIHVDYKHTDTIHSMHKHVYKCIHRSTPTSKIYLACTWDKIFQTKRYIVGWFTHTHTHSGSHQTISLMKEPLSQRNRFKQILLIIGGNKQL